jgi:hypothetical protein
MPADTEQAAKVLAEAHAQLLAYLYGHVMERGEGDEVRAPGYIWEEVDAVSRFVERIQVEARREERQRWEPVVTEARDLLGYWIKALPDSAMRRDMDRLRDKARALLASAGDGE